MRHAADGTRHVGADHGLDVAGLQQLAQRFAAGIGDDRHRLERRQHGRIAVWLGFLHRPFHPLDGREVDAVIVLQQAADPDGGGHGVELDADALALEVLRRLDHAGVDRDEAVPEHARGKCRDRHKRAFPCREARHVFRGRHFRGVEFLPRGHAVEQRTRIIHGDEIEIDAGRPHLAGIERGHAVVEAAGERHRQRRHANTP
jgi:hypothetical protein